MNKMALGMIAATVIAGSVNATDYYFYGSTAYRKVTFDAVKSLFTAGGNTLTSAQGEAGGVYVDRSGAAAGSVGDTNWVIVGILANQGLGSVTVHGNWAGSVGGYARLTHRDTISSFIVPGANGSAVVFDSPHIPDLAMQDTQPCALPGFSFPTPGYSAVVSSNISGLDFVIAANAGFFPSQFTNVSSLQLQALYNFGSAPLGQLTGNVNDNTNAVYAVGRDDDSGTRAIFALDIGNTLPASFFQYKISGSGVTYAYTYAGAAGINWPGDGGGYAGGGDVKNALLISNPQTYANGGWGEINSIAIGYLAVSDWNGSGLKTLSYNGVPYSRAAILEGAYSYWGKENINIRSADFTGNASLKTLFQAIYAAQKSLAGGGSYAGTFQLSTLDCDRSCDGKAVFHN